MDKDRIEGAAKQAKGAVKDAAGKVMGDKKMQAEGKADKTEGKVQNTVGGAKDTVQGRGRQGLTLRELNLWRGRGASRAPFSLSNDIRNWAACAIENWTLGVHASSGWPGAVPAFCRRPERRFSRRR